MDTAATWKLRIALLTLLAALFGSNSVVHASCAAELKLLWTYPEAGAAGVPTNATLWALTSLWGSKPAAQLNGEALDVQDTGTFSAVQMQPARLEPNTDYALMRDYPRAGLPANVQSRFEIAFRTGSEAPPDAAKKPDVTGSMQRDLDVLSAQHCGDVIAAQDCFDTVQDVLVSFQIAPEPGTEGFLLTTGNAVGGAAWPVRCADPTVLIHRSTEPVCYQVQRIGAGGRLSEAVEHCSEPSTPVDSAQSTPTTGVSRPPTNKGAADAGATATPVGPVGTQPDAGAADASTESATPIGPVSKQPSADGGGCSAVGGARTAARAFWAVVLMCLLVASERAKRRRTRPRTGRILRPHPRR